MSKPIQQHFVPKIYLKFFSPMRDGKNLQVLNFKHPYRQKVETKDSGDSIFCGKKYYNSEAFEDTFFLEKFFAQQIEELYPELVRILEKEEAIMEMQVKVDLFTWIFYNKFRSPVVREYFEWELKKDKDISPQQVTALSKQAHLKIFTDEKLFNQVLERMMNILMSKKWLILKTTDAQPFITSDSPGYHIDLAEAEKQQLLGIRPSPFLHKLNADSAVFFPLTSNYMLVIHPYPPQTPVEQNLTNTAISYEQAGKDDVFQTNLHTTQTAHHLLIGSNTSFLEGVEDMIRKGMFRVPA